MTVRGCAYAGSKGVVWGPIKDMVHVSHGPVGCGQYSRAGRRNYYVGTTGVNTFGTMNFTSDFQEKDIVFGGDKKLDKIITKIEQLFPLHKGVTIQSECPIGLIGDDIEAVAKKKTKEFGKPVVPVRCEGFRGVSQSLGHHIANDAIRDWVIGNRDGDGSLSEIELTPKVKLNLIHCYRSMNYLSRHLEEKYGIPLDRVQLLRSHQDRRVPAHDRRLLRRDHPGQRRAGHRQVPTPVRGSHREIPAPPGRKAGHALCWRSASAPYRRRL